MRWYLQNGKYADSVDLVDAMRWSVKTINGQLLGTRRFMSANALEQYIVVFGGKGEKGGPTNVVEVFDTGMQGM